MFFRFLKYWINGINLFGLYFIIGHLKSIYFIQDVNGANNGNDVLTLKHTDQHYYKSKIQHNPYWGKNLD